MSAREIKYEIDARQNIMKGVDTLANAVKVTLGPKGRNVLIGKTWGGAPLVTKDGVSVAREVELEDKFENMGARMVREVAAKTSDKAGDGTTTATVLAQAIYREGAKLTAAGANPMLLKRGMDQACGVVVEELKKLSRKVGDKKEIAQIGTISANNDATIGNMISEAMEKVGKDGVITIEEAKGIETVLDIVEGMQFDRGYILPYFVTNPEKMEVVLEDPYILLHEKKISNLMEMVPLLEQIARSGQALLIVAEEVEGEALAALVVNKMKGTLKCAAVKAPAFGDRRKAVLEDIAILTGGQVISEDKGLKLESTTLDELGRCKKITIDKDRTIIVEGAGRRSDIDGRVQLIRAELAGTKSEYDQEKLQERLAKIVGGVAVLKVGAATEVEMKEKKARVDDALNATQAAVEEGIIPGGGVAFIRAGKALDALRLPGEEQQGVEIIKRALEAPLRQIAVNAGAEGTIVVEKVKDRKDNSGFDAERGEYVDMLKAGIIDPTKVAHFAIVNAVSVASLLLTTEATIAEKPKKKKSLEDMPKDMGYYE